MKLFLGLIVIFLCVEPVFAQEVISNWDDSAAEMAGWEKTGMTAFTVYHNSGGNPNGYIEVYGNLLTGIKNRQAEFTGDYIAAGYNNISLDIMVIMQQLPAFKPVIELRYSPSFAGWNYELGNFTIENAGTWQHFDIYFDPTWSDADAQAHGWYLASGPTKTFQETLAHIGSISVKSNYPQITSKNIGYDNFMLSHVEMFPESTEESVVEPEASQGPAVQEGESQEQGQGTESQENSRETKPVTPVLKPIQIQPKVPTFNKKPRVIR